MAEKLRPAPAHVAWMLALVPLLVAGPAHAGRHRAAPSIALTTPVHGSFSTAAQTTVAGQVRNLAVSDAAVTVNGAPVPLAPDGSFSTVLPLDPQAIWNPVLAELTVLSNGVVKRTRSVVIAGQSVPDGGASVRSVAMRLNDSGLDQVEPLVESLVDLDVASLLPVGSTVFDECLADTIFGCSGGAVARVIAPEPTFTSFRIDVDSMSGAAAADITIDGLQATVNVDGWGTLFFIDCDLRITADTTSILGDYDLSPDAAAPTRVDVSQLGGVAVTFGNFQDQFLNGACDFPIIGDIIQAIVGDIEPTVRAGLESFLDDPDGAGPADGPIADAIETALAGVEISGPIGASLGVSLETPIFDIVEDADGLTFDADAIATAAVGTGPGECAAPPDAPDLPGSYHVDEAFPTFAPTTPAAGLPYDLALCVSTSAFNQLLKAGIECGLLRIDLTEFDFGTGPQPITAGLLGLFVPEFQALPPTVPLVVRLRPTLAPLLTGQPGPGGELVELRIGDLRVQIADTTSAVWLEAAVEAKAGLDLAFDAATGEIAFALGPVAPGDVSVSILGNAIRTNETAMLAILPQLLAFALPAVADDLGTFPIPDFLGLGLAGVETSRQGEFLSLFLDLTPTP